MSWPTDMQRVIQRAVAEQNLARTGQPETLADVFRLCSPRLDPPDHLAPYVAALEKVARGSEPVELTFHAPPQHGKELHNATPIETRRGWTTVGDVKAGDEVVASDGSWTRVVNVWPQPVGPMYRITFGDGSQIVAGGPHRWATQTHGSVGWIVRTTEEMFQRHRDAMPADKWSGARSRSRYRLPVMQGLQRPDENLLLDPYLLGCWLGDGTTANGGVTSMDPEIHAAFAARFAPGACTSRDKGRVKTILYKGLTQSLRGLGVLGDKHIPIEYLRASEAQRLALLQGLCDTDGTVAKNGSQQSFCTTLARLRDDFRQLVFSLGGHASTIERAPVCHKPDGTKVPGQAAWNIYFRLPARLGPAFRLVRKANLLAAPSGRNAPRRVIAKIERVEDGPGTCFEVDAPDHLFCAGREYIVSHNSEAAKHALIFLAILRPGLRHAYATYNSERAMAVRNQVARLALEAGLAPHTSEGTLTLRGGTEIRFVGRGTALTGNPIDGLLIVDDILKDRAEAVSQTIRDTCWDWFVDVAQTRRHPGSSVVVMNTRWVQDDLIGRLVKRWNWEHVRLAAECDAEDDPLGRKIGEALWPKARPLDWLQQHKRSPLTWASMYQGQPRPAGDALFQDAHYYDALPRHGSYRLLHGVDLAYTEKTRADWSVHVKGRWYPESGPAGQGALYLTDVFRAQMQADRFTARLAERVKAEAGPCLWFGNTVERGTAALIRQSVPTFQFKLATTDKYVRALPTAEQLWNVGRLLVPSKAVWLADYVEEITQFTGEDGATDDQVDATAAIGDLALRCAAGAGVNALNQALRGKGGLRVVA